MKNALYAQAGGVTAVINASAAGVIETARRHADRIGTVFAARHGIFGIWNEELIDTNVESPEEIALLRQTPGGAFGSCRYDVKSHEDDPGLYKRIFEVFAAHDIGYFFYNGGNGSMDTAWKLHLAAKALDYPLISIGVPKTIDNDLVLTDCCPGYGSTAKYVATAIREVGLDLEAMAQGKPKIFLMEVMGRNAGWIAAASALACEHMDDVPHVVLLPEVPFDPELFIAKVQHVAQRLGYCAIVVSEGVRDKEGRYLAERGKGGGYVQLGGAGLAVADLIRERLGFGYHLAIIDYLQRAGRHIAARIDVEQAYAAGAAAVEYAMQGLSGVMPAVERVSDTPYRWFMKPVPLEEVGHAERSVPREYISADGMGVTEAFRRYALPLIEGEDPPRFHKGLPVYAKLRCYTVARRCPPAPYEIASY
ncbi:6-phosphofructokinase [Niveibacterium sp. SC-1]|uniref:6-phosphofructokinase n=1 Tax=Niveibacterium sp. SC-1 TaxID=3135646 RepID=UPI00311F04DF